jgi:hypothetical protein
MKLWWLHGRRGGGEWARPWTLIIAICLLVGSDVVLLALWLSGTALSPGATGAIAGAIVSGVVAVGLSGLGVIERREMRREEHLLRALDYFTGKTQRRSVGISVVEGLARSAPELHPVIVPTLVNQGIYLVSKIPDKRTDKRGSNTTNEPRVDAGDESDGDDDRGHGLTDHEKDNLDRIVTLLSDFANVDRRFRDRSLQLVRRIREKETTMAKDSSGKRDADLRNWIARLEGDKE